MNTLNVIRPARRAEIPTLAELIKRQLPDMMASGTEAGAIQSGLGKLIDDGALLLATAENRLAGMILVEIDQQRVIACFLDPKVASPDTPKSLFSAAEGLLSGFGARWIECASKPQVQRFMESLGYRARGDQPGQPLRMHKSLVDPDDRQTEALFKTLDELGIPENYGTRRRLKRVPEARLLIPIGRDIFDRDQKLTPSAATAWSQLHNAAANQGVTLQLVSAYRSVGYQASLIRRKLDGGQSLEQILKVSAAPGFSEHHGGQAIDLTAPGLKPLDESFAESKAYAWLKSNAGIYGFKESFPVNNRHGISWEPWHWRYHNRAGR
ncbi:MAG: M15 family metallopeptidase [Wenzhouxiangella sp.]